MLDPQDCSILRMKSICLTAPAFIASPQKCTTPRASCMLLLFGCLAELPGTGMIFWQEPSNPDSEGPGSSSEKSSVSFSG